MCRKNLIQQAWFVHSYTVSWQACLCYWPCWTSGGWALSLWNILPDSVCVCVCVCFVTCGFWAHFLLFSHFNHSTLHYAMDCGTSGSCSPAPPCCHPPLSPGSFSNSFPLYQWCYITSASSVAHFSFCLCLSQQLVFSNKVTLCIRWTKYWSFSLNISPSNEYSKLISFKIDWFDLLAVQGTLKSLLQPHNLKASILPHSAFFMVQLTSMHDYCKNHSFHHTDLCQ